MNIVTRFNVGQNVWQVYMRDEELSIIKSYIQQIYVDDEGIHYTLLDGEETTGEDLFGSYTEALEYAFSTIRQ